MYESNSVNRTKKELIEDYLKEVEKKLPFWLKSEKNEVIEILEELENHIWDKATEIGGDAEPTEKHINLVISQMGTPNEIAAEYKRRGKPKFYITEELFPLYLKTLLFVGIVITIINIITGAISIGTGGAIRAFFNGISVSFVSAFLIVTILFVILSKEGYLPENLQRFSSRFPSFVHRIIDDSKKKHKRETYDESQVEREMQSIQTAHNIEADVQSEGYVPIKVKESFDEKPRVSILREVKEPKAIKETIIIKESRIKGKEPVEPKRIIKYKNYPGGNYLFDGITGIVFGTTFIILAFLPVMNFLVKPLNYWLALLGGTTLVLGVIRFMQALIGKILRPQQGLMFLSIIPTAAKIPLWLVLLHSVVGFGSYQTQVMNLFELIVLKFGNIIGKTYVFNPITGLIVLKVIVYLSVGVAAITIISELSKIARLEFEGFPIKEIVEYR